MNELNSQNGQEIGFSRKGSGLKARNRELPPRCTGLWIRADLYRDGQLSLAEVVLLAHIENLDHDATRHCYASNRYLANRLGMGLGSIANMISRLIRAGYLERETCASGQRALRLAENKPSPSGEHSRNTQDLLAAVHCEMMEDSFRNESNPSLLDEHNNKDPFEKKHTQTKRVRVRALGPFRAYYREFCSWWLELQELVTIPPKVRWRDEIWWLFENGFTLDEVKTYHKFITTDYREVSWRRMPVQIGTIVKGIADWRKREREQAEARQAGQGKMPRGVNGCDPHTGDI